MLVNCWVLAASHVQQEHWYKEAQKASLPRELLKEPLQAILLNLLSQQIKKLCILKASSASQLLCPGCKSCSTGALVQGSSEGLAAKRTAEGAFASNPAEVAEPAMQKLCIFKASSAKQLLDPGCKSHSTGALVQWTSEGLAARNNAERAFASNPAELAESADKKALHLESLQC